MNRKLYGFTLVELAIVITVIAILAAVSIATYNGIQDRARITSATDSAKQASERVEVYEIANRNYPENLSDIGVSDTNDTKYQYRFNNTTNPKEWCMTVTVGNKSVFTSSTQAEPIEGGCAGHGVGGVAAITNVAVNPGAEGAGGWYSNSGTSYPAVRTSTVKRSGVQSVESHGVSSGTVLLSLYAPGAVDGTGFTVQPSTTYTVSLYFRSGVPHQGRVACAFRLSDGTYTAATYGSYVQGVANQWTRATYTCTSPANATKLRVVANVYALTTQPAGTSAYVDDLMVTEGTALPNYADGDSSGWVWNGSPHASSSTGVPK